MWANAWNVFCRALSRVGGRRAAVNFVVRFGWGAFFSVLSMSLHFQIQSQTQSQSSHRGLGEEDPTASQSAHRELAPTYPHQVYRLVWSHLRNLASAVDQYSSSRPASLIFDPTSECNLNKFFSSFESASCICSRERNSGRHTQGGRGGMCSDTLNPGGEVRVCCVGCILGMPEISPFAFIAASYQLHGIL